MLSKFNNCNDQSNKPRKTPKGSNAHAFSWIFSSIRVRTGTLKETYAQLCIKLYLEINANQMTYNHL